MELLLCSTTIQDKAGTCLKMGPIEEIEGKSAPPSGELVRAFLSKKNAAAVYLRLGDEY